MLSCFLFFVMLHAGLAHAQTKIIAKDKFNNSLVTLSLNSDMTYTYEEKFLDGSLLKDTGKYTLIDKRLALKSTAKSKREHHNLKFKTAIKFKNDALLLDGSTYRFQAASKSRNGYLEELDWLPHTSQR